MSILSDNLFLPAEQYNSSDYPSIHHDRVYRVFSALNASTISSITDTKGVITSASKLFCEISGYNRSELIGQNHRIINSGFHTKEFWANLWKTIHAGRTWRGEIRNKKKDGSYYWVDTIIHPIFNERKEITEFLSVRVLISARKALEKNLQEKQKLLNAAESLARLGGYRILADRKTLEFTAEFQNILQTQPDKLASYSKALSFASPETQVMLEQAVAMAFEAGKPFDFIVKFHTESGQSRSGRVMGYPEKDESGQTIVMGILQDITQLIESEENLKMALAVATKASQAKSEFLSAMSHEIRTPINAILGIGKLLNETKDEKERSALYQHLDNATSALISLLDDILDISRIETGKIELEDSVICFKDLSNALISVFTLKAKRKNISLEIENQLPENLLVKGDRHRLQQIISNLVSNAIKFTHQGGVTLRFLVLSETQTDIKIRVSVADTGIGMPQEFTSQIFDPFVQADAGIQRKYGGSGLGLAISKKLAGLMGTTIQVQSVEGTGTEFWFDIQFHKFIEKANGEAKDDLAVNRNTLEDKHILLVDDNEINLMITERFLRKWNVQVSTATSGKAAIEKCASQSYDAILLDLQMPEMDGFETAEILLKDHPHLVILALTADALTDTRRQALKAGMRDFITKPIEPDKLKAILVKNI